LIESLPSDDLTILYDQKTEWNGKLS